MTNFCITCGVPIWEEDRQVCKACENHGKREQRLKSVNEELKKACIEHARKITSECEYCVDGICVNADSPLRADYCLVPYEPGICRYEKRKE